MTQLPRLNAMVEFLEAHEPAEMARLRAANPAAEDLLRAGAKLGGAPTPSAAPARAPGPGAPPAPSAAAAPAPTAEGSGGAAPGGLSPERVRAALELALATVVSAGNNAERALASVRRKLSWSRAARLTGGVVSLLSGAGIAAGVSFVGVKVLAWLSLVSSATVLFAAALTESVTGVKEGKVAQHDQLIELRAKAAALEPRIRLYLVTGESDQAVRQCIESALELTGQLNRIADAIGIETKLSLTAASA